jgi:hypothetical protein
MQAQYIIIMGNKASTSTGGDEQTYRTNIWIGIKNLEIEQLQKSATNTQKELDKIRKQFLCQSILLKEAFDGQLKQQINETNSVKKELDDLKQRLQRLEFVVAAESTTSITVNVSPSSMMATHYV